MKIVVLAFLTAMSFAACGPNTLATRGTVLHPLHKFRQQEDAELGRPDRILVIVRKEPRQVVAHRIAGAYVKPVGLGWLQEPAEIPPQDSDGSGLLVEVAICSDRKDEIVHLDRFRYALILDDERVIEGSVHRKWPIQNFTQKVTGARHQPYMTVRDPVSGRPVTYSYVQEVENDIELHCGKIRLQFTAPALITPASRYVVFVMTGFGRERRYWFDFTYDVNEAMRTTADQED